MSFKICLIFYVSVALQFGIYEADAWWISERGRHSVEANGSLLSCSQNRANDNCLAMWQNGSGFNPAHPKGWESNEHYWELHLDSFEGEGQFGLTNVENFAKGIIYTDSFGPRKRSAGETIGILATITDIQFRVFYSYNNEPLELAYELETRNLRNAHPAVNFHGVGQATISTDTDTQLRSERTCINSRMQNLTGWWTTSTPDGVRIAGNPLRGYEDNGGHYLFGKKHTVTLRIQEIPAIYDQFKFFLTAKDYHEFKIKHCDGFWKTTTPLTTKRGGDLELQVLDDQLLYIMDNPDSVMIVNGKLTFQKENILVTFIR